MNKKVSIILSIIMILISLLQMKTSAVEVPVDEAYIYANKETDYLLKWNGTNVYTHMAVYNKDGVEYPAYCMNRDLPGVKIGISQTVDVKELVNNVMVWRVVTNGYPYKSLQELGCETEEEAYLATKQAVYSILANRDIEEYTAIGESGERTLNALKKIVNDAKNSNAIKVSSELSIKQKENIWKVDNIDKNYISQEFSVSANAGIKSYTVDIKNLNIEGFKITDKNNNERKEFKQTEVFKVLIPIVNIKEDGSFIINVKGEVSTKPVFYGESRDSGLQNYALTGYTYEDGEGSKEFSFSKNETKILIVKQDEKGLKRLKGVEFCILDENEDILFDMLKTDENGEIELSGLLPGVYYIKETKTIDGFKLYDEPIKTEVGFNEKITINVINKEEPTIEVEEKVVENKIVTKLPKTGM